MTTNEPPTECRCVVPGGPYYTHSGPCKGSPALAVERYGGLISMLDSARDKGFPIHVATRTTCAEHIEHGDDKAESWTLQPQLTIDAERLGWVLYRMGVDDLDLSDAHKLARHIITCLEADAEECAECAIGNSECCPTHAGADCPECGGQCRLSPTGPLQVEDYDRPLPPCPICGKTDLFIGTDGKLGCPHCEVAVVLPSR